LSYLVEFEGKALIQLHGLPAKAFEELVELIAIFDVVWIG
jgi:hypothetical protein